MSASITLLCARMQDLPKEALEKVASYFQALSEPTRLALLNQLRGGERNVGELEALLGILQPTLSQQLAVLRREGLVDTRRDGKQVYYRISSASALALINTLYQLFCAGAEQ